MPVYMEQSTPERNWTEAFEHQHVMQEISGDLTIGQNAHHNRTLVRVLENDKLSVPTIELPGWIEPAKPRSYTDGFIDTVKEKGWNESGKDFLEPGGIGIWDCDGEPMLLIHHEKGTIVRAAKRLLEKCQDPAVPQKITYFTHPGRR